MKLQIIDTHAHYDSSRFKDDRHDIIKALPQNGIEKIINVGCDVKTTRHSVKLAETYSHVFATAGAHPHYVKDLSESDLQTLIDYAKHPRVVAFGEIGLDFFHNFSPQATQREWFKKLLQTVRELDLPAIIHSRDANDEVYETIKSSPVRRGVIHAFSGDAELASKYVELGFYIGVGGVVTFKKSHDLAAAVAAVPLERILLETDCPYLSPEPFRGKRNESAYLTHVAEKIAIIKGVSVEAVCEQTTKNAERLFNI